ncbi:hypothetical protein [Schleiferia thermophila]|jgi:hypothetical protein|uniref:Uncharacterized protein n=1 Tax=Schleiferia thermophila TaxID=884107 RepID=A0A369A307_9FLAO|nr:hypothetical protein [Schleiferia thermophila]KFD38529.1 hypothetical protein AT05_09500 [Schleiferia thermophila str. Yellowstone]RCX03571.1 hypothetical protein DES35_10220 [Schleiferia thermophila]GCD79807.1 hypothetical protein JCM30197_10540 [Schleiferia thermophila]
MKKLIWILLALIALAIAAGLYLYFKPVKDLTKSKPDFWFDDLRQLNEVLPNIENNPGAYIGKIFEISGNVTEYSAEPHGGGYLVIESKDFNILINAQLDHRVVKVNIQENRPCTIKAEFTGMEEDLIDPDVTIMYFKQAVILNPKTHQE